MFHEEIKYSFGTISQKNLNAGNRVITQYVYSFNIISTPNWIKIIDLIVQRMSDRTDDIFF